MKPLEIKTADGVMEYYEFTPPGQGPWPIVLFLMDGVGIRESLRGMCRHLAEQGYLVLLPDLYYRSGRGRSFNPQTVFTNQEERAQLMEMINLVTNERVLADMQLLLGHYDTDSRVKRGSAAVIGYCMGGGLAVYLAARLPERISAAAAIHPGRLMTGKPDSPNLCYANIRGEVYFGIPESDSFFDAAKRELLSQEVAAAGFAATVELYEGVAHGFAIPDMPVYDSAAAGKHWEKVLGLLNRRLQ